MAAVLWNFLSCLVHPFFHFYFFHGWKYICCNENTSDLSTLDVTRNMVRTSCGMLINEVFNVSINNSSFKVRVVE